MLALCSMLMLPKFIPIILKLCQHNWSKPIDQRGLRVVQFGGGGKVRQIDTHKLDTMSMYNVILDYNMHMVAFYF